ncbi:hypothetical protein BDV39DRAFT_188764 [Aspergillus sergii]|uniref:FAD/NAD(P)-binding domain-containing protein n=1 Tax=Aspergillus sergii TaxID=1034303 RepID=A0A5N6XHE3_9EURO|nr:hypothetical protein BDV39DRAFT_188764 [Aspergillus sergii]
MANPINTNRRIRVIIIGAGASGLLMAYKLQRNFDNVEFQIYEKNPDIGGTWYENRYPGCACDNPSHTYVWVARCTTFIREPTWVAVSGFSGFQPRRFEPDEKDRFTKDPKALHTFRRWLEHNANKAYPVFFAKSEAQEEARNQFVDSMKDALKNPGLEEKVIPPWAVGCRRLTPGVGYLESLNHPKTTVVYGEINRITNRGCQMEDGKEYPPRFPLTGLNGRQLSDDWKDEPRSYLGIAAAGYPNYYMFLGPNSPIGNGPVLVGIEAQADYICKHITRIQQQGIKSIEVTKDAVDDFIEHKDQYMKEMVWNEDCRSWYKGNTADGKIVALWPGSTLHYIDTLRQVRYEDFKVQYFGNRFSYLGNGMSKLEMTPDADLAYYIRERDDAPIIGSKFIYKKAGPELTAINMTAAKASEETITDMSRL